MSGVTRTVANIPDAIVLKRDRDLEGRKWHIWVRRGLFTLLPVVTALALANVFGQRPATETVNGNGASLELHAPNRVRGGLLFQARFNITAEQDVQNAVLLLDPGWLEGMTLNTLEPSPEKETSDNGRLRFELGPIAAGDSFLLFAQFQTNPTNVGHRSQAVELYDNDRKLLELDRSITIFP